SDEHDDGGFHLSPRESFGRPGTRAPHLWLEDRGQQISSLDLYGRRFVLLAGAAADEWCRYGRIAATELGIDLDIHRPAGNGLEDGNGALGKARGIDSDGCLLVRPDGFVAWRARTALGASVDRLKSALRIYTA